MHVEFDVPGVEDSTWQQQGKQQPSERVRPLPSPEQQWLLPGSWGVNLNTSLVDSLGLLLSLSSYKKGDPVIAPKNRSPVTKLSVIHGSQYLPGLHTDHSQVSTSSDTMWSPPRPLLEEQPPIIPSVGFLTSPRLRLGGKGLRDNLADIGPS